MSIVGDILNPFGAMIDGAFNYESVRQTNATNERINERQLQAARELQQYQNEWNEMMWNKNNEYNTPSYQRKLLESAGYNPYMMYNGGSGSQQITSATGSVPSAIPMQAYQSTVGRDIAESISRSYDNHIKAEQAKQLSIQTDFAYSKQVLDIQEQKSRIKMSNLSSDEKAREIAVLDDTLNYLKHTQHARINQTKEESNKVLAEREMLDSELFDNICLRNIRWAQAETGLRLSNQQVKNLQADLSLLRQKVQTEHLTQKQIKQETKRIFEETLNVKQVRKGLKQQYRFNEPAALQSDMYSKYLNTEEGRKADFGTKQFERFMERFTPKFFSLGVKF